MDCSNVTNLNCLPETQAVPAEKQVLDVPAVESRQTPKCFRQIGHPDAAEHIYIEDYVQSYLMHFSEEAMETGCLLAIYGTRSCKDGCREWYLDGAAALSLSLDDMTPEAASRIWDEILQIRSRFFQAWELVGWLLQLPTFLLGENVLYEELTKTWFGNQELCVLTHDIYEKSLQVYFYNGHHLELLPGHYIYYDRNVPMQEYMVEHQWNQESSPFEDKMAEAIRTRFRQPQDSPEGKHLAQYIQKGKETLRENAAHIVAPAKKWSLLTVITVVTTVTFLLLLGIFLYTQHDQMNEVAEAVRSFTEGILTKK